MVLEAGRVREERAGSIRFSFGRENIESDADASSIDSVVPAFAGARAAAEQTVLRMKECDRLEAASSRLCFNMIALWFL